MPAAVFLLITAQLAVVECLALVGNRIFLSLVEESSEPPQRESDLWTCYQIFPPTTKGPVPTKTWAPTGHQSIRKPDVSRLLAGGVSTSISEDCLWQQRRCLPNQFPLTGSHRQRWSFHGDAEHMGSPHYSPSPHWLSLHTPPCCQHVGLSLESIKSQNSSSSICCRTFESASPYVSLPHQGGQRGLKARPKFATFRFPFRSHPESDAAERTELPRCRWWTSVFFWSLWRWEEKWGAGAIWRLGVEGWGREGCHNLQPSLLELLRAQHNETSVMGGASVITPDDTLISRSGDPRWPTSPNPHHTRTSTCQHTLITARVIWPYQVLRREY